MWSPLAYFSRKFKLAETRYSTFDRELLAIYLAIKHYQHFLEGQQFSVITDHKPLTFALASPSRHHLPCQIHHLDFISQFTSDIQFIKGVFNVAADALTRLEVDALNTVPDSALQLDFSSMAHAQQDDSDLLNSSSLQLHTDI